MFKFLLKAVGNSLTAIYGVFNENLERAKYSVYGFGLIGSVGHPFYYLWWTYVDPRYENILLRIIGTITCLGLFTQKFWKKPFDRFFPFYWFLTITFNLPFFFTTYLIQTDFHLIWSMAEVAMVFFLVMLYRKIVLVPLSLIAGVCCAVWYSWGHLAGFVFNKEIAVFIYFPVFLFAVFSSFILNYSGILSTIKNEKDKALEWEKILQSLAASIAHELRNPLGVIQFAQSQIKNALSEPNKDKEKLKLQLTELTNVVSDSVIQANQIIDIILADLKEKPIDPADFQVLDVRQIVPDVINRYGYKDSSEKQKISLALTHPFVFKAIPERFSFILYNLLKNALYYLNEYPRASVTVGSELRVVNGVSYNSIYVHDTGPGIAPDVLPKLFGEFVSVGKKEGTGLGLAFCKRNMRVFGGDIVCDSEYGRWTRFSLLFPQVPADELAPQNDNTNRTKILFVSDQFSTALFVQNQIGRLTCDIANSAPEAKNLIQKNQYRLVFSEIDLPGLNAVIPVKIGKNASGEMVHRMVMKWLFEYEDNFLYLGKEEDYIKKLQGKRVLVTDDQRFNRMFVSIMLQAKGVEMVQASNGNELMDCYQNSLDEEGKSSFGMIITDINMPHRNGDDVSKEIRKQEQARGIEGFDGVPIIAMSGDGAVEDLHHFFECGMTDYFVKGTNQDVLVKLAAVYLGK